LCQQVMFQLACYPGLPAAAVSTCHDISFSTCLPIHR
jgi:hypothetical protein